MSPRVRTPKVAPTVWRERLSANINDRQTFWAMRRGHFLTVTVARQSPDQITVTGKVTGKLAPPAGKRISYPLIASANERDALIVAAVIQDVKHWAQEAVDKLCSKSD